MWCTNSLSQVLQTGSLLVNAKHFTLRASKAVVQCIVIGPVCKCVCLWVCYHDNSKLRASILTKLGLEVKVVTISSWLNFGHPVPPGRGSAAAWWGEIFGSALLQPTCSICVSSALFNNRCSINARVKWMNRKSVYWVMYSMSNGMLKIANNWLLSESHWNNVVFGPQLLSTLSRFVCCRQLCK